MVAFDCATHTAHCQKIANKFNRRITKQIVHHIHLLAFVCASELCFCFATHDSPFQQAFAMPPVLNAQRDHIEGEQDPQNYYCVIHLMCFSGLYST